MVVLVTITIKSNIAGVHHRSTLMRDTSYTARGRSSTWASLWSTSLRSVSGFQMTRQRTNRRRRTAKALASSHCQLYSTICNISLELDPPIFCCPIWFSTLRRRVCMCKVTSAYNHPFSPCAGCWQGPVAEGPWLNPWSDSYCSATGQIDMLMSSLCSAPSGGQSKDQRDVHWAIWLHSNCGTLMKPFAAQYILLNSLCWH